MSKTPARRGKAEAAALEYKPKSCWEVFAGPAHAKAMDALARGALDFLSQCKTERQTAAHVRDRLLASGFGPDFARGKVLRVQRNKTVFLARRGKRPLSEGLRILCAHSDSPRLDFKQHPLYEDCGLGLAKTHYYGGIRKHQWLARPLALHGVIVKKSGETVSVSIGEDPNDPVFTVLDLLPHLAQQQQEKTLAKAFDAEKLNVALGHAPLASMTETAGKDKNSPVKAQVLALLHEKYAVTEEDLFSAELQIVPAGPARFVGLDRSLLGGYGQDDRISVFAALEAFQGNADSPPEHTQVLVFWDKEEIGSDGATGATSRFFEYCIEDCIRAWSPAKGQTPLPAQVLMNSKALSADVHAAMDPDYQDLHEKLNSALLGYGPCFCKATGHRGKYGGSDAEAEYVAWLRDLLAKAGIPWQMAELGRVDQGGGGTVAKHLAVYGMNIIDFGQPILSMHSPFEISSKVDLYATMLAFRAFLKS